MALPCPFRPMGVHLHKRITGTRLATAVTAVLAVTALGAGTLATAPAAYAAPAAASAFTAEESGLPVLPLGSSLDSVGTTGALSYSMADGGGLELLWTPYDNGTPTKLPLDPNGYWDESGTDVVALGDSSMRSLTLRNMATPAAPGVTIDLAALDGDLVAVLSPTSVLADIVNAEGYSELHIVTKNGDATTTTKVDGLPADVSWFQGASALRNGTILVAYETGTEEAPTAGRAVIDVASSSVIKAYDTKSGFHPELQLTDSHVGWFESDAGSGLLMTTVDRATGVKKQTRVGDLVNDFWASLVGGWLVYGDTESPAKALNLADGSTLTLDVQGLTSVSSADGSVTLEGSNETDGTGLFRITAGANGAAPVITKTADISIPDALEITEVHIADSTNLDATGGKVTMGWTLSRTDATIDVTITNTTTDASFTKTVNAPATGDRFTYVWDGTINGVDAPNGEYAVEAEAYLLDDSDYAYQGWLTKITRNANVHDYNNNGSTDLLVRDSAGVLWREDLRDRPVNGLIKSAQRTRIGSGWNTYKHIEAVGNVGGAATGDLLTVDSAGVLWNQLGKGDGTFAPRRQLGTGWGIYNKITGGSDLTNDGKADLIAVDTSGAWWLRKGTGDWAKPFGDRIKMGTGWNTYNQIVATGNIAGGAAGDLVGRDTSGVLWLHLGKGDGTFAPRVKIGSGWNVYSQLVAAGDVDSDGRLDLYAYGSGGSVLYRGTGSYLAPFTKTSTSVFTSELTKFTSVS